MSTLNFKASNLKQTGFTNLKWLISTLTIVMLGATSSLAQNNSWDNKSSSIRVTGSVVAALGGRSILIETIYNPSFQTENIDDNQIIVDPISDEAGSAGGAGLMVAKGEPRSEFQVVMPDEITLINSETNCAVKVNVDISHNVQMEQSSSDYVRNSITSFTLNETGEYYFWLGGSIDITNLEEGPYKGNFLLEVEYL